MLHPALAMLSNYLEQPNLPHVIVMMQSIWHNIELFLEVN